MVLEIIRELICDLIEENDMKRWHEQGFVFSTDSNRATCFGLAQQNGGPRGVLVPIQVNDYIFK